MSFKFSKNDFDNYVNQGIKKKALILDSIKGESAIGLDSQYKSTGRLSESNEGLVLTINEPQQYQLQSQIREAFGRSNTINTRGIADHQDFSELIHGGQMNHFITTIFVDIKGSTSLSLKYPDDLEFIYKFKNAVIKSCIEVIHAFDGCVHRIMGDAVLGFFGSSEIDRPQSILDCLNAAAMLTVVLEHTIKPWLQEQKSDFNVLDFGFRVGCNFGNDDEVLWGNYGFGQIGEISPTGLPVDLAAKLQSLASKNQIMMGQGLLEFFNFPNDFCKIKTVIRNGETIEKEFIYPNYKKADGTDLNYIMRSLKTHKYILGLPLPLDLKQMISVNVNADEKVIPNNNFKLKAEVTNPNGNIENYYSNSRVIRKDSKIKAILSSENIRLLQRYKVIFYKKNHSGFNDEEILKTYLQEEIDDNDIDVGQAQSISTFFKVGEFQRDCNFKGLHHIKCEVKDTSGSVIFRDYIYVPIE